MQRYASKQAELALRSERREVSPQSLKQGRMPRPAPLIAHTRPEHVQALLPGLETKARGMSRACRRVQLPG